MRKKLPVPPRPAYAATKGGLIALTKSLAREVGGAGVTVNALAPGPVETEMLHRELWWKRTAEGG